MWISLLFKVVWTIWRLRNPRVFEEFKPVWDVEIAQVKVREVPVWHGLFGS